MNKITFEGSVQEYGKYGGRVYLPKKLRELLNISSESYYQVAPISRNTEYSRYADGLRFYSELQTDFELNISQAQECYSEYGREWKYIKIDSSGRMTLNKTLLDICGLNLFDQIVLFRRHNGFELWSHKEWKKFKFYGGYYEFKKEKNNLYKVIDEDYAFIQGSKEIKYIKRERLQTPSNNFFLVECFPRCFLFHLDNEGKYKKALNKNWNDYNTLSFDRINVSSEINLCHMLEEKIQIDFYHNTFKNNKLIDTGKRIYAIFKKEMPSFYLLEHISEVREKDVLLFSDDSRHEKALLWTNEGKYWRVRNKWIKE